MGRARKPWERRCLGDSAYGLLRFVAGAGGRRPKKEQVGLTGGGPSLPCRAPLSEAIALWGVIFGILGGLESKRVSLMRLVCVDPDVRVGASKAGKPLTAASKLDNHLSSGAVVS